MDLAVLVLGFVLCGAIGVVGFLLARRGPAGRERPVYARPTIVCARPDAGGRGRRARRGAGRPDAPGDREADHAGDGAASDRTAKRAAETARAEALARNLADQRELLDAAKAQLGDTFQALAAEALRTSQEGFLTLASERLGAVRNETALEVTARHEAQQKAMEGMVAPVRASLAKVDEQIQAMERLRGTAYGSLTQQMQTIAETQEKLRAATGNLVSALKAPAVRGQWGEMQLRRVVEMAGMIDHCDFHPQVTVDGEDGRLRPDMVVRLPGGRNIVVDAKAPMAAYLDSREAPPTRSAPKSCASTRTRCAPTSRSCRPRATGMQMDVPPEVVVMFLPGESLYSAALEQMPGLIEEGFAQRVLVATPTTLLGLLRAMGYGWREERLAENAQRISDEGRRLHERIATVLDHFSDLGRALGAVGQALQRGDGLVRYAGWWSRPASWRSWTRRGRKRWRPDADRGAPLHRLGRRRNAKAPAAAAARASLPSPRLTTELAPMPFGLGPRARASGLGKKLFAVPRPIGRAIRALQALVTSLVSPEARGPRSEASSLNGIGASAAVDFVERARPIRARAGRRARALRARGAGGDGGPAERLDRHRQPQGADGRGPPRRPGAPPDAARGWSGRSQLSFDHGRLRRADGARGRAADPARGDPLAGLPGAP